MTAPMPHDISRALECSGYARFEASSHKEMTEPYASDLDDEEVSDVSRLLRETSRLFACGGLSIATSGSVSIRRLTIWKEPLATNCTVRRRHILNRCHDASDPCHRPATTMELAH